MGSRGRDIDWLVPHQANRRIIDSMGKKLGLPPEKVVITIDRHANTSAASVPLALAEAVGDGRIKPGQLVLLEAMGGGFTWGAAPGALVAAEPGRTSTILLRQPSVIDGFSRLRVKVVLSTIDGGAVPWPDRR